MGSKRYSSVQSACWAAATGGLLFGFDTAVISGVVDMVKHQFAMDNPTEGWFVSCGLAGCILGVIFAGLLADKVGRKAALILSAVLFFFSAIGCAFAQTLVLLIISRLTGGIGVGIVSVIAPMFISEMAPAKSRGKMVAIYQLAITIGILAAYLSNALLLKLDPHAAFLFSGNQVWRSMFLVMTIPSMIFLFLVTGAPESPRWLIAKGSNDKASAILHHIYPSPQANDEYGKITASFKSQSISSRSIFSSAVRPALIIGILLAAFQQFSGINAVIYYGPKIFKEAGFASGDALQTQAIIGVANLIFTIAAIYQADRFGRKNLLISGLIGIIISLVIAGYCFYSGHSQGMLLVAAIIIYVSCFAFSLGPVTWILINEIFPNDLRLKGVSICNIAIWLSVFLVGQLFPWAIDTFGVATVFWIFALISAVNLLFCLKVLKETKGQSLEEIEMIFTSGH